MSTEASVMFVSEIPKGAVVFIDQSSVCIEDLIVAIQGLDARIVRCYGNPNNCIRIVHESSIENKE